MELLPLTLSVKALNWRMYGDAQDGTDTDEHRIRRLEALARDNRTCRFCGFRASRWQEIGHLNDDHADNRLENLATICPFCHLVHHIGLAGRNKEAVLTWAPEISQADVNHLVRSALVSMRSVAGSGLQRGSVAKEAELHDISAAVLAVLGTLTGPRVAAAKDIIGTSDPIELAQILQMMANDAPLLYERRAELLTGLRLLPLGRRVVDGKDIMNDIVDSWFDQDADGPYASLQPASWAALTPPSGRTP